MAVSDKSNKSNQKANKEMNSATPSLVKNDQDQYLPNNNGTFADKVMGINQTPSASAKKDVITIAVPPKSPLMSQIQSAIDLESSQSEFPSKKTPPLVVEKRKIQPVNLVDSSAEKTLNDKIMVDEKLTNE